MSRIVYVNGEYLPEEEAKISIFDRGFLFADGVYEVSTILDGKLVDNAGHLARLQRSLAELDIPAPCSMEEIETIQHTLIERNAIAAGSIYLQVTRGAEDRNFLWSEGLKPSLIMFTQSRGAKMDKVAEKGLDVISQPDIRWQRRDIKTVALLPASLAKRKAIAEGANDAWLVEDGMITEGTSNNAHIITKDGKLVTRALSNKILHGITRKAVLALAKEAGLTVEERSFSPDEVKNAAEAFVTSATMFVTPVVSFDGVKIGDGKPGPHTTRLRDLYVSFAKKSLS
ncbi:D-alanine transaminase [Cohaesibacter marisflavi]|uniref:Probable branched-chain-amino-acid aminotransferase n=1 Tax=Cohaesibacter marisflavi TaxID=655353 RepID=A0A1I4ZY46_9HYPH|nr:D-amino-acid transaminase [Cohaesibacter marisflavi]SFN54999.1 D-alanine transaminase [Cohaesibacter marisflavi]